MKRRLLNLLTALSLMLCAAVACGGCAASRTGWFDGEVVAGPAVGEPAGLVAGGLCLTMRMRQV
jgi:hypothetical protein